MLISLDMDSVVVDMFATLDDRYRLWFDDEPTPSSSWHLEARYPAFHNNAQVWEWIERLGKEVWAEMPPIPGALGAIWDLQRMGHELIAITARHDDGLEVVAEWLKRHSGSDIRVYQSPSKQKFDKAEMLSVDLHIDDSPRVAEPWPTRGKPALWIYEQPWNRHVRGYHRVANWSQFVCDLED